MSRRTRLLPLAGILVVSSLLSGCGRGLASGSGAGVAARVGSWTLTTADFSDRVERSLANETFAEQLGAQQADFQRQALTQLIRAELMRREAAERGVTVTAADEQRRYDEFQAQAGGAAAFVRSAAENGVSPADLRQVVGTFIVTDAVADDLVADEKLTDAQLRAEYRRAIDSYDRVKVRHILVNLCPGGADFTGACATQTLTRARSLYDQLRRGGDFAALAKAHSVDTSSKDTGGVVRDEQSGGDFLGRGALVAEFARAAFGAKKGALVPPVRTDFGYHVIQVLDRRTTAFASVRDELRRSLLAEEREKRLGALFTALSKRLGVSVSPRFGRWDDATAAVVPREDELSTPAPKPTLPGVSPLAPGAPPVPPPGG